MDAKTAVAVLRKYSHGTLFNLGSDNAIAISNVIQQQDEMITEQSKVIDKYNKQYLPASEYIQRSIEAIDTFNGCKNIFEQQEKYAKLGRLALTTKAMICSNNDFIKRANHCENHCINYGYCRKRAELLAEVQK